MLHEPGGFRFYNKFLRDVRDFGRSLRVNQWRANVVKRLVERRHKRGRRSLQPPPNSSPARKGGPR